ncbi:transposable element Tcb2 transposase [Trichonephila clavipes]|nr:transposable element Tcb2 transposase [Trichonephila clavipes]
MPWFTVTRRLHKGGLFAPVLSTAPFRVMKGDHSWTSHQWSHVLFTDEGCFGAPSDSKRRLIWRDVKTWFHPSNITYEDPYGDPGVVIWGSRLNGQTHVFNRLKSTDFV